MKRTIEVFVDIHNRDNAWGIITTRQTIKHIPRKSEEIIKFKNVHDMNNYLSANFGIDDVTYHTVDYDCVEYRFYNGHPNLNCIVVKYYEYKDNRKIIPKKIGLPKKYEQMFVEIIKTNKNVPMYAKLSERYHRDVDVYEESAKETKEIMRCIKMNIEEFFTFMGDKINSLSERRGVVRGIKLVAGAAVITTLLHGGYKIVTDDGYKSTFIKNENGVKNVQDIDIHLNKKEVGQTIEKLIESKYDEVDVTDIKKAISYIQKIEDSNYDKNNSRNVFNFKEYFDYKLDDVPSVYDSSMLLEKIEQLYNNCFITINGKNALDNDSVKRYADFVASLTFMYDTYHSDRPFSGVDFDSQSIVSKYARSNEISTFDNYPPILRYIILNQLKGIIQRSNYHVDERPAYYQGGTDKYSLISEINEKLSSIYDEMLVIMSSSKQNRAI